jgi:hypothetical protein
VTSLVFRNRMIIPRSTATTVTSYVSHPIKPPGLAGRALRLEL